MTEPPSQPLWGWEWGSGAESRSRRNAEGQGVLGPLQLRSAASARVVCLPYTSRVSQGCHRGAPSPCSPSHSDPPEPSRLEVPPWALWGPCQLLLPPLPPARGRSDA